MEENRIPVDFIAGTSMGAIVGGMYAAGMNSNGHFLEGAEYAERNFLIVSPAIFSASKVPRSRKGVERGIDSLTT